MLFRGGDPDFDNGTLDYQGLIADLSAAAKAVDKKLPQDFLLIDICLLNLWTSRQNSPEDRDNSINEFNYFQKNPDKGSFIFWETLGVFDNVTVPVLQDNIPLVSYLAKNLDDWMGDRLVYRMEKIRQILYTKYQKPAVIFGHCDCGCDRTGETFGSYYMKWLNMTWEDTNKLNAVIAERPMDCFNYLAMQWYCLYLKYEEGRDLNCFDNQICSSQEVCVTMP